MSKLYLPIGLIGSGKSTWARQFIKKNSNTKIVGGDEIRFMLNGGEYFHHTDLEPTILAILFRATMTLLGESYNVILDECYCSLSKDMRLWVRQSFPVAELIAVVFPERDMQDHIDDKVMKGLRGKTVNYWKRVFREMKEVYEPFHLADEPHFNSVIEVQ